MLILSTLQTFVLKSVQTSFPVFILNFFIVKSISIFLWTVPLTTISLLNFTGQSPRLQRNKTPSGKKSNFFDCNRDARLFVLCANWYAVFIHYTIARNSSRPLPQLPPLQTHTDIFFYKLLFCKASGCNDAQCTLCFQYFMDILNTSSLQNIRKIYQSRYG